MIHKYSSNQKVVVLINEKNVGFSKGNNVGIRYARNILHCKFVVVMNNDVYLIQDDFFKVIKEEYETSHFAILGPRIDSPNKSEIYNPMRSELYSKDELDKLKRKLIYLIILNYLGLENDVFSLMKRFKKRFYKRKYISQKIEWKKGYQIRNEQQYKRHENVQIHGCGFVLSDMFFEVFQGLDPRTFMFFEESILYAQVMKANLLTVYNPNWRIYHKESSATDAVYKTERKLKQFVYKNSLASLKILAQYID